MDNGDNSKTALISKTGLMKGKCEARQEKSVTNMF